MKLVSRLGERRQTNKKEKVFEGFQEDGLLVNPLEEETELIEGEQLTGPSYVKLK